MRKRKRRWPRAAGKKLVSLAAVGVATAAMMGMLPRWEANGFFVETAQALTQEGDDSALQQEGGEPAAETDPDKLALLRAWEGILFDFYRVSREGTTEKVAFVRELLIRLESLSGYDFDGFEETDLVHEFYAAASAAQDILDRAAAFEESSRLMCSVFAELDRIKNGGVFTRGGVVEFAEQVLRATEETENFFTLEEAGSLAGTQFEVNRAELFSQARSAAEFLIERMDTLSGEVGDDQNIVFRYALGGGWDLERTPGWLVTDSLKNLADLVRKDAVSGLFELLRAG
jgi:hypothetical protein